MSIYIYVHVWLKNVHCCCHLTFLWKLKLLYFVYKNLCNMIFSYFHLTHLKLMQQLRFRLSILTVYQAMKWVVFLPGNIKKFLSKCHFKKYLLLWLIVSSSYYILSFSMNIEFTSLIYKCHEKQVTGVACNT